MYFVIGLRSKFHICHVCHCRTVGAVIVGVAFVKLLSILCNIIRQHLQLAPWRVEVVSDNDPRVHPIDPRGVCIHLLYPFSENLHYL